MHGPQNEAYWEMALNMGEGKAWKTNKGEGRIFYELARAVVNRTGQEKKEELWSVQKWLEKLDQEQAARARGELPPRIPDYINQYGDRKEEDYVFPRVYEDDDDNSENDEDKYDNDEASDYETEYEGDADDEDGDIKVPVGYIDIAPFFQPVHVWDEYEGGIEGEDYFHGGVVHNHYVMNAEEQAIHDAQFAADMYAINGDRGYASDFNSGDAEEEETDEEIGQRMTDPEDAITTDDDNNEPEVGNPRSEEDEEDEEQEDWDITNPLPVRLS